jgi:hypothetical protein
VLTAEAGYAGQPISSVDEVRHITLFRIEDQVYVRWPACYRRGQFSQEDVDGLPRLEALLKRPEIRHKAHFIIDHVQASGLGIQLATQEFELIEFLDLLRGASSNAEVRFSLIVRRSFLEGESFIGGKSELVDLIAEFAW